MKIASVAFSHINLSQSDKNWRISLGNISETLTTILRLTTDSGVSGYGAAPIGAQLISGECHASAEAFLRAAFPLLKSADPLNRNATMSRVSGLMAGNARVKAGIDAALCDLAGRLLNVPVATLFGGALRRSVPVIRIVPIADPEKMASFSAAIVAAGFRYLKLKMSGNLQQDVDRVGAVRSRCGPEIHLTIDANQAYSAAGAAAFLRAIEQFNVDMAEQPVSADDFDGLAIVRLKSPIPILADESIRSVGDALRLLQMRAADFISIKVGHLGGYGPARRLAQVCEAAGVGCLIGANTGGRMVEAANMHFIASTPGISYACEIGEFLRLSFDPTGRLECVDGELHLPPGPGLGVEPDAAVNYIEISET
jgi:L-alanine-DL-glutamate epimerase-like enolase superfamily enzyme